MIRLRYADEWVGLLVVAALAILFAAILQAGVLRDWFRPVSNLRLVLPEAGVAGLAVGADVDILGTPAGVIRRVVISPSQQMYAEAEIDDQARAFIRRDSVAVIRRRFGIAGAAFVDISRGTGAELDWKFAVIEAITERDPTESVGALLDQVREKIFPILDDVGKSAKSLAGVAERIDKGQGNVGRLVNDETMMRDLEATVAQARAAVSDLTRLEAELDQALRSANTLGDALNAKDAGVPGLLHRANDTLVALQQMLHDLALAAERTPQIARNVEAGTQDLPALLIQVQQTAREVEQLAVQVRGVWLLGGGPPQPPVPVRLPSQEVRP
ncbi:MAG TPA: MlaD family protein [Stellaceae bacterium]|nr:MlaD family protein [Stellaceae bacterium]